MLGDSLVAAARRQTSEPPRAEEVAALVQQPVFGQILVRHAVLSQIADRAAVKTLGSVPRRAFFEKLLTEAALGESFLVSLFCLVLPAGCRRAAGRTHPPNDGIGPRLGRLRAGARVRAGMGPQKGGICGDRAHFAANTALAVIISCYREAGDAAKADRLQKDLDCRQSKAARQAL